MHAHLETAELTFRTFDPEALTPAAAYTLLAGLVVPRPIAWVSTCSAAGVHNLAPFSFANAVGGPPPVVMFAPGRRSDGSAKDSLKNARETREFVLHIADESLADVLNRTAGAHPPDVSEFGVTGLATVPADVVGPLRVAAAPVALEARVQQIVPVVGTAYTMVLGRVLRFHVREDILDEEGLVLPERLKPLSRLGGVTFGTLGRTFALPMPEVTQ